MKYSKIIDTFTYFIYLLACHILILFFDLHNKLLTLLPLFGIIFDVSVLQKKGGSLNLFKIKVLWKQRKSSQKMNLKK